MPPNQNNSEPNNELPRDPVAPSSPPQPPQPAQSSEPMPQPITPSTTIQPNNPSPQPPKLEPSDGQKPFQSPAQRMQPTDSSPTPAQQTNNPHAPVDTTKLFQPDKPGTNPFNDNGKSRRKKALLGTAAGLFAFLLIAGWVFGFYLPNKPDNVWRTGLDRTGDVLNELVTSSTEKEQLEQIKKSELSGSLKIEGEGVNFDGSFSSKYGPKSSDSKLDVKYTDEGAEDINFNAKLLTDLPDNSELPNIYFKVTGLNNFGVDQFLPEIAGYDGKWISISSKYLESVIPPDQRDEFKKDKDNEISKEDVAELARIVSGTTQEYVFTSDTDKSVLDLKEFVGTEEQEGGITANHYKVGFNKANAKKYCEVLTDRFMSAEAYKKLPGVNTDNIESDKKESIKSCQESVDKDIKDNYTFDVWVDKKYKLIHKLRFSEEKDKGTYIEVGQTFKGDDILPLFVIFHSDKDKYDAKIEMDVNTKEAATKGSFVLDYTGDTEYSIDAAFEFKPYEGNIDVEKPKGAIPIERLFRDLGFDPIETVGGTQIKAKDTKRKSDINAIYSQIEVFFAINGYYPSLNQINSEGWRTTNLQGATSDMFKDPDGSSASLARNASVGQYGYNPTGCDSIGQRCTGFTLTAMLSNGQKYQKLGSNN